MVESFQNRFTILDRLYSLPPIDFGVILGGGGGHYYREISLTKVLAVLSHWFFPEGGGLALSGSHI